MGLIPTGVYTCNKNYGIKAMMRLLHMEDTDGVQILQGRNVASRRYRIAPL